MNYHKYDKGDGSSPIIIGNSGVVTLMPDGFTQNEAIPMTEAEFNDHIAKQPKYVEPIDPRDVKIAKLEADIANIKKNLKL